MTRKTTIRLLIIVPLLIVFSVGTWIGVNMLVARQLSLIRLVEIGDLDGIQYVCRWNAKQVDQDATIVGVLKEETPRMIEVGFVPLVLATRTGNVNAVRALLAASAQVDQDSHGYTALHLAAIKGHAEIVELLVAAGASIDARINSSFTPPGWTALGAAVHGGHKHVVEILLAAGADVNAMQWVPVISSGSGPLENRCASTLELAESEEMKALLRKHGAKTSEELKAKKK